MDKSIMPECYADTLLIETLVPTKAGYNHKTSCFKIEGEMKFGKLKDRFAVGIIDNDKKQIKYLEEFEPIDKLEGSLILWKHKVKTHFIIQLCPALEKWILDVCKKGNIDIENKYGLVNGLESLKKYTKTRSSIDDEKLKMLFKEICEIRDLKEINKLRGWVSILKEKNYQADINELTNG